MDDIDAGQIGGKKIGGFTRLKFDEVISPFRIEDITYRFNRSW